MGKLIPAYAGFSATAVKNKASNTCDMAVSGTNVDCTNITVTRVKNVLGVGTTAISSLCNNANVNIWSGYGPKTFITSGNIIMSVAKFPYSLGSFAGYNHSAGTPYFYFPTPTNVYGSGFANTSVNISSFINLKETNWPDIWPNGSWFILADGVKVANFTTADYTGNTEKNITLAVTAPAVGQSKTYTVDTWIGNTSGGALNGKLAVCSGVSLTLRIAMTAVDSQNNRDTAINALSLAGSETVGRIWAAGTGLGFTGNSFTGNFNVNADISAVPGGAYKRTVALCNTALMRGTLKAYKTNGGVTSSTYTVATLVRILPNTGFTYAVPAALLPITDDDNYFLYFDNLI